MNARTTQDIERLGKMIAIGGVVLFGISLIAHIHYKGRFNSIRSYVSSIEFKIRTQVDPEILDLASQQKLCKTDIALSSPIFFGCDPDSLNKRSARIADLETQLKKHIEELKKPLPDLYQQGNQEYLKAQLFFYLSIITLIITIVGILLIFGRSLAFINRGGDISIGNINNSRTPINSGQKNTAIAGESISDISVENYSNSVKNLISHLPTNSSPNAGELKRVLAQIQELIMQSPELGNDEKLMALEQIKVLTESSANPTNLSQRKVTNQAMMILKGIVSSLPDALKLADILSKLLTSVSKLLGLI